MHIVVFSELKECGSTTNCEHMYVLHAVEPHLERLNVYRDDLVEMYSCINSDIRDISVDILMLCFYFVLSGTEKIHNGLVSGGDCSRIKVTDYHLASYFRPLLLKCLRHLGQWVVSLFQHRLKQA